MSVTHDFSCMVHGAFEAKVRAGTLPPCPKGCSPYFVRLVFLTAPSIATERVRTATRLVREAADAQGLTDIDVSPSRPGSSVADRNFKRSGNTSAAMSLDFNKYIKQVTPGPNQITRLGMGNAYDPHEWRQSKETGKLVHAGAAPPREPLPVGQFGVEVKRMRGD